MPVVIPNKRLTVSKSTNKRMMSKAIANTDEEALFATTSAGTCVAFKIRI
jgi:hypothetical protein